MRERSWFALRHLPIHATVLESPSHRVLEGAERVFESHRGPFGFTPDELEDAIIAELEK